MIDCYIKITQSEHYEIVIEDGIKLYGGGVKHTDLRRDLEELRGCNSTLKEYANPTHLTDFIIKFELFDILDEAIYIDGIEIGLLPQGDIASIIDSIYYEVLDVLYCTSHLKNYLEYLGYYCGRVTDYHDSAYYIAAWETSDDYIYDLWTGTNFYNIEVFDDSNFPLDSLYGCYILDDEDLADYAADYFGIARGSIKLLDDTHPAHWFDYPKYKMVPTSYQVVKVD